MSVSLIVLSFRHLFAVCCLYFATAATAAVGGESYLDVIERIRPVIIELERQRRSVLVVCHLAVLRCIHAYFMGTKLEDIPYKSFQRHTLYKLEPGQPLSKSYCGTEIIDIFSNVLFSLLFFPFLKRPIRMHM